MNPFITCGLSNRFNEPLSFVHTDRKRLRKRNMSVSNINIDSQLEMFFRQRQFRACFRVGYVHTLSEVFLPAYQEFLV